MSDCLLPDDDWELRALVAGLAKQMKCEPDEFYFSMMVVKLFQQGRIEFKIDENEELVFRAIPHTECA